MALAGLFVDDSAVEADLHGLAIVTLLRRHELDPAVAVLVVVPVDELGDPLTGLVLAGKWLAWVIGQIIHCPEQRFRVRVVVADARSGERPSTPSSSKRLSNVAARMALPLSACKIRGCLRPLLIRSRRQALLTRSAAIPGSSRSATSQATTLRLQTSITK